MQSWLNYLHYHESRISSCISRRTNGTVKDCGHERVMWYSIVDIGLMLVISLEDYVEGKSKGEGTDKDFNLLPSISVQTESQLIIMDLFAVVHHKPGHWVCRSMLGNQFDPDQGHSNPMYYYDDLKGYATQDVNVSDKVTGIVYVKRMNSSHINDDNDEYKIGSLVTVLKSDGSGLPLLEGKIQLLSTSHAVVEIMSTTCPDETLPATV